MVLVNLATVSGDGRSSFLMLASAFCSCDTAPCSPRYSWCSTGRTSRMGELIFCRNSRCKVLYGTIAHGNLCKVRRWTFQNFLSRCIRSSVSIGVSPGSISWQHPVHPPFQLPVSSPTSPLNVTLMLVQTLLIGIRGHQRARHVERLTKTVAVRF